MSGSGEIAVLAGLRKRAPTLTALSQYERAGRVVEFVVSEHQRRLSIIDELYRLHARLMKDAFADACSVGSLPPDRWLNEQLKGLGEIWRVQCIDGFRYEIYDAV